MNVETIQNAIAGATAPPPAGQPPRKAGRMSLANATQGRVLDSPLFMMLYAKEKVGKTTFAMGAPGVWFLPLDGGTNELDLKRLPKPETLADVFEALAEVEANGVAAGIKTLVVDPVNWLDMFIAAHVLRGTGKTSVQDIEFGKGKPQVITQYRLVLSWFERIRAKGINVIVLAHAKLTKVKDPTGEDYPCHAPAFEYPEVAGMFMQAVDAFLYAEREVFGVQTASKKVIAGGDGKRVLYTDGKPGFEAGNRWHLPLEMKLSWTDMIAARAASRELLDQIEQGLKALGPTFDDSKVRAAIRGGTPLATVAAAVAAKVTAPATEEKKEENES